MKINFYLIMVIAGLLAGLLVSCSPKTEAPAGFLSPAGTVTDLSPQDMGQVKDFRLTDQNGKVVNLYQSAPGLTLVAFTFTHCTDICPFVMLKMKTVKDLLGPDSQKVRLVSVSVDPERDTAQTLKAYSQSLGMETEAFLTGTRGQLEPIWKDFKVAVVKDEKADEAQETAKNAAQLGMEMPASSAPAIQTGLKDPVLALGRQVAAKFGGGYEVTHSSPVWVVNGQGKILSLLEYSQTPEQMAQAVKEKLR